jgi:peroxiredoxin
MYRAVISQGDEAPRFELPALVDGDHRRVALEEFLGEDVVILAFYPGDFNPACDEESDLDELDLFTMQKDVSVLGVSSDSLYSHGAFAEKYDLHIPLLSDTRRRIAQQYGVTFEDDIGQELIERAVFVVDHDGIVQYAWSTREMLSLPDVDAIKDAIGDTGGDDTAFARYRIGYAHYTEGRRAFTSAMGSYQDSEWMLSQSDFKRAQEEFEEAADHFNSAVRFADDPEFSEYYEQTEEKATALWQAAEWLTDSASAYSSGSGAAGQRLRDDAERPLESARDIGDPIEPDEWPPDFEEDDEQSILPETERTDTELAVDIDEAATENDEAGADSATGTDVTEAGEASDAWSGATEGDDDSAAEAGVDDQIDDDELEEIEAELATNQPESGEPIEESPTSMVDAPPDAADGDAPETDGEAANEDDIDGDVGEADLERLEADLEASQSAAEDAQSSANDDESDESDDPDPADGLGGATDPDPASEQATANETDTAGGLGGATGPSASSGPGGATGPDELSDSAGTDETDVPPPGSGSLEPTGGSDDGGDLSASDDATLVDSPDNEDVLDGEPAGASDEEMAAIPTEDDLADDDDEDEQDGDSRY